ncbi:MAG: DUF4492 domain-containing protein [Muribaculaceae bacterium]|nr:DUF4492 domain-containing protein [Muribaculaceae bacterium]
MDNRHDVGAGGLEPACGGRDRLRGDHWWSRVWWFYIDGFRSMTVGRTLWAIIAIKVVVFFLVLRWIFFPDFLATKADTDEGKADYVRRELMQDTVVNPASPTSLSLPTTDNDN